MFETYGIGQTPGSLERYSLVIENHISKYKYNYITVCPKARRAGLTCSTHQHERRQWLSNKYNYIYRELIILGSLISLVHERTANSTASVSHCANEYELEVLQ